MIEVRVYLTHANTFSLVIKKDNVAVNLINTGVNRMVVNFMGEQIDSSVPGEGQGCFDWTTNGADGIVEFSFSSLDLSPGRHRCSLTIFDPSHSNGQVWNDLFEIEVYGKIVT